jgi:glycerol-3-phosphate dehydrogenase
MIGPTEKPYRGAVSDWRVAQDSVEEFIAAINTAGLLPVTIGLDDVLHAYGGLRPLTEDAGGDTYNASRAAEVVDHAKDEHGGIDGLITATGGKYTTSRAFAHQVVQLAASRIGRTIGHSRTAKTWLHGCSTGPIEEYIAASQSRHPDFSPETVRYVARHHGTEHDTVLDLARATPGLATTLDADGELLAQVAVAARHESARTLSDILLRRTGLGTLGLPGDEVLDAAARLAAAELGWDDARREAELEDTVRALTLPWHQRV